MNAILSIELELFEPVLLESADHLRGLHPSQVRGLTVRLATEGFAPVVLAQPDDTRLGLHDLIAFAQAAQPQGTTVLVWYQGRSESFVL